MSISLVCPSCKTKLKVSDQATGKSATCPGCKEKIPIPSPKPKTKTPIQPPHPRDDPDAEDRKTTKDSATGFAITPLMMLGIAGTLAFFFFICVGTGIGLYVFIPKRGAVQPNPVALNDPPKKVNPDVAKETPTETPKKIVRPIETEEEKERKRKREARKGKSANWLFANDHEYVEDYLRGSVKAKLVNAPAEYTLLFTCVQNPTTTNDPKLDEWKYDIEARHTASGMVEYWSVAAKWGPSGWNENWTKTR